MMDRDIKKADCTGEKAVEIYRIVITNVINRMEESQKGVDQGRCTKVAVQHVHLEK